MEDTCKHILETDQYWTGSTENFYLFLDPQLQLDIDPSPPQVNIDIDPAPGTIPVTAQETGAKTTESAPLSPGFKSGRGPHQSRKGHKSKRERTCNPVYTCSQCGTPCFENRALCRHLWAKHPRFAEQNKIPAEKEACPIRGCGYQGRKDNVLRHQRLRHQEAENIGKPKAQLK